jgi:ribose transport system permease protein
VAGTTYTIAHFGSAPLLSPTYLLQQLQIGSFLGIVAAGMMIVILIARLICRCPGHWRPRHDATSIGGPLHPSGGLASASGRRRRHRRSHCACHRYLQVRRQCVMRGLMVAHTGGYAPRPRH